MAEYRCCDADITANYSYTSYPSVRYHTESVLRVFSSIMVILFPANNRLHVSQKPMVGESPMIYISRMNDDRCITFLAVPASVSQSVHRSS